MPVAVAGTVLSLLLAEIGLRAVGFSYPLYPEKIEFGWPTPEQIESYLRAERELFWVSKDYFRNLDIARRTRPSVVFMGCSCTQWGRYDEILARMVPRAYPQRELSYANLGIAGPQGPSHLRCTIGYDTASRSTLPRLIARPSLDVHIAPNHIHANDSVSHRHSEPALLDPRDPDKPGIIHLFPSSSPFPLILLSPISANSRVNW